MFFVEQNISFYDILILFDEKRCGGGGSGGGNSGGGGDSRSGPVISQTMSENNHCSGE